MFASLTWKIGGVLVRCPSVEQLLRLVVGDGALLAHGVAKNDPFGAWFASTPTFLGWFPDGRSACRELVKLELMAAVAAGERDSTPLFGPAAGDMFAAAELEQAFFLLLSAGAGVPEERLTDYSLHAFRIFLACALLASNAPRWLIKRIVRWRGDDSLEVYARMNDGERAGWSASVREARVDSTIVSRLPRLDFSPEQVQQFDDIARGLLRMGPTSMETA